MVTQAEIRLVTAAFPRAEDAQAAVADLKNGGFDESEISVVYTDTGHAAKAGLLTGAVWGGVLGALFGILFPPLGLIIAAGPIAGVLASGAVVGAAGALTVGALDALIAALVQIGLPKELATGLGERIHKGDTVVIVHSTSEERARTAAEVLAAHSPRLDVAPNTQGVVSVEHATV
jgi:hypothetical protein